MPEFEGERLEIYEEWIDDLPDKVATSHGDYVYPSFTGTVAVDDGYKEADVVIEITVANEVEKTLVLMASRIVDGQRQLVEDVEDEDAISRARKYASEIENGAYFGLINQDEVYVGSIDPDLQIEETRPVKNLSDIIEEIIHEERRIKDSQEFIEVLREYNDEIEPYIAETIRHKLESESDFRDKIIEFLTPIGMDYDEEEEIPPETLDMLSRQTTYLLVDKILFYYLILENEESLKQSLDNQEKYDEVFEGLNEEPPVPQEVNEEWSREFWSYLEHIFDLIKEIDYQPIFDPRKSPLNEVSLESHPAACFNLKELMDYLYDTEELSNLFDGPLLAKIYEGLIPPELRWKWGQIYTPPEITRLITQWTVQEPDARVLDPACGTGRFLVSAYRRLAELKDVPIGEKHQEIIDQTYGIDINQFPAHLATMSLVAMSLDSITEKVHIDVKDFFLFNHGEQSNFEPEKTRVRLGGQTEFGYEGVLEGQGKLSFEKPIGEVDAITMNPPYTRQEALDDTYKEDVRNVALSGIGENGNKVKMSKRASFYSYFMTHATKFLKDHGRFGMIIQNSWLDVDYGKDIQKFLLDNFKINAIIGTQKHRLIRTADVNTVILLLEKAESEEERHSNTVKFVQLKRGMEWFEGNYGLQELLEVIEENEELMNDDLRVISKSQEALEEEGMGASTYTGGKWGKYIRAPDIYFKMLDHGADQLVTIEDICEMERGLTTGANDFFYVPKPGEANKFFESEFNEETGELLLTVKDKITKSEFEEQGFDLSSPQFRIEKQYWMHRETGERAELEEEFGITYVEDGKIWVPNYVVKSPKELEELVVYPKNLQNIVLMIDDPKSQLDQGVTEYIEWGETWNPSRGGTYSKRDTCAARDLWYELPDKQGRIFWMKAVNIAHYTPYCDRDVFVDNRFYIMKSNRGEDIAFAALLNSYMMFLVNEVEGRVNLGEGALDRMVYEVREYPIVDLEALDDDLIKTLEQKINQLDEDIYSVFEEVGSEDPEEVSLDEVNENVRALDRVIMEDILNLSKKDQFEIYRGVIQLAKDRIEKARSVD